MKQADKPTRMLRNRPKDRKTFQLIMPRELAARVDDYADKTLMPRTQIMRLAAIEYLERHHKA